jgi:DNA repair exonuclease SbcCD ATPase subunit
MIVNFKKVKYKNFFSTGNAEIEFDFQHGKFLIVGKNGAGKSTLVSAVVFALFGKPIKELNKPQIVNTINNKNCVTEIEFNRGTIEYRVVRGIKPNIFEIYEDGVLLDQTRVGDYQTYLDSVIGCDYKHFIRTVMISVENYQPFMMMKAAERRSFVDEIIDLGILTMMKDIHAKEYKDAQKNLQTMQNNYEALKEKFQLATKTVETISEMLGDQKTTLTNELEECRLKYQEVTEPYEKLTEQSQKIKEQLDAYYDRERELQNLKNSVIKYKQEIEDAEKKKKIAGVCPTCSSSISGEKVDRTIAHAEECIVGAKDKLAKTLDKIENFGVLVEPADLRQESTNLIQQLQMISTESNSIKQRASQIKSKLQSIDESKLTEAKEEAKSIAARAKTMKGEIAKLQEQVSIGAVMTQILKDDGIKKSVIEQYLSEFNSAVYDYTDMLELSTKFSFDGEFNEQILSRDRDNFSYNNLSRGEKAKLDMAILMAFRKISQLKAKFQCNILFCDEVLETLAGDSFVTMIEMFYDKEFDDMGVYVVSHKATDTGITHLFDDVVTFSKDVDGFSYLEGK